MSTNPKSQNQLYLIWSDEHGSWWRPHSGGYTRTLVQAGRYDAEAAAAILESANRYLPAGQKNEFAFLLPEELPSGP